jgi:tRNA1Val (adenine37-N6)-methyltransferase
MANPFFRFKQFTVFHDRCAMKVTTDACLFGAWCADQLKTATRLKALDIGTGTGLLSLMIAQKCALHIDAVEIDPEAAMQAAENRTAAGFENISILQGDIRGLHLSRYDIIFSNPPFYEQEIPSAQEGKRVAHHSDGLSWQELFAFIATHLSVEGMAYLLLPSKRRKELDGLLQKHGLYLSLEVSVQPTPAQAPSRLMIAFGKKQRPLKRENIVIAQVSGYSEAFTALLKDYYLYL